MAKKEDLNIGVGGTAVMRGVQGSGEGRLDRYRKRELSGHHGSETYLKMLRQNPLISGAQSAFEASAQKVAWRFRINRENKESRQAKRGLEILERSMANLDWSSFISDAMLAGPLGFALFEMAFDVSDKGMVVLKDLSPRPQETIEEFIFNADNEITAAEQRVERPYKTGLPGVSSGVSVQYESVTIPAWKLCLIKFHNNRGDPRGRPALEACYKSDYYINCLEDIEAIGIEKEFNGVLVIELPPEYMSDSAPSALQAKRREFEEMGAKARSGEFVSIVIASSKNPDTGLPSGFDVRLLENSGSRSIDQDSTIKRHKSDLLIALLSEWLLLGVTGRGTNALGDSKMSVVEMAVEAAIKAVRNALVCQVLPVLMVLNGIDEKYWPEIEHGLVEAPNLNQYADFFSKLKAAGAISGGPATERFFRETANMPEEEEEFVQDMLDKMLAGEEEGPADAGANLAPEAENNPENPAAEPEDS